MKIRIVSGSGKVRNQGLVSLAAEVEVVGEFMMTTSILETRYQIDQIANQIFLSRTISNSEAGCLISHMIACSIKELGWVCILEDDAEISNLQAFYEALDSISSLEISTPTIITIHAGVGGYYKRSRAINKHFGIAKIAVLPVGCVGYIINERARDIVTLQTKIVGVADWPTWSAKINFFQLHPPVISHSGIFGTLQNSAQHIKNLDTPAEKFFLHRIRKEVSLKRISSAGGFGGYAALVIKPWFYKKFFKLN
jgi:hypothetical protein